MEATNQQNNITNSNQQQYYMTHNNFDNKDL